MDVNCIDTRSVAPDRRFELFYEFVGRKLMPMTPQRGDGRRDFQARLLSAKAGARCATLIAAPNHPAQRDWREIKSEDPRVFHLVCILQGNRTLHSERQATQIHCGEMFVVSSSRPFSLDGPSGNYTAVMLTLPQTDFAAVDIKPLLNTNGVSKLPTAKLLYQTMACVAVGLETADYEQIPFLISVALGAVTFGMPDLSTSVHAETQPKLTIEMVRIEIERGLSDPTLSIEGVAARVGVSVRALQRALAKETRCFRNMLQRARMRAAHRMLVSTSVSIQEVAYACGYLELSAFYRAFRRHYDSTPADLRASSGLFSDGHGMPAVVLNGSGAKAGSITPST